MWIFINRRLKMIDMIWMIACFNADFLKRTGDNCPVMKSIHPDIEVNAVYKSEGV